MKHPLLFIVAVILMLLEFFYPKRYFHSPGEVAPHRWEISKCFGIKHNQIYGNMEFEKPLCYGFLYGKQCYLTPGRSDPTPCV